MTERKTVTIRRKSPDFISEDITMEVEVDKKWGTLFFSMKCALEKYILERKLTYPAGTVRYDIEVAHNETGIALHVNFK